MMNPMPNNEHQQLVMGLSAALYEIVGSSGEFASSGTPTITLASGASQTLKVSLAAFAQTR